jgi:hypothetical protein
MSLFGLATKLDPEKDPNLKIVRFSFVILHPSIARPSPIARKPEKERGTIHVTM